MDKLKSVLSRNKEEPEDNVTGTTDTTGSSGKMTGAGSHFPSGTGATDSSGYSLGGKQSEYTTGSSYVPGNETTQGGMPSSLSKDTTTPTHGTTGGTGSGIGSDGPGTAVIGETSTYSSQGLAKGDPVSSVADTRSGDSTTYGRPETASHGNSSALPAGSAATAASLAFRNDKDKSGAMPGGFPSGGTQTTSDATDSGLGGNTSGPMGTSSATSGTHSHAPAAALAATGASGPQSSTTQPSTLSSTTGNTSRPTEFSPSSGTQATGSGVPTTTAGNAPTTSGTAPTQAQEPGRQGMMGKVLGAVGLGGAAGATAGKLGSERDDSAVVDSPNHPTTTTGTSSYTAPTESGPGPAHHRKESIPTTAYPAGPESPTPISAPVGGTTGARPQDSQDHHYGRDAAIAGAGVGTAGVGAHEYDKNRSLRDDTTREPSGTTSGVTPGAATSTPSALESRRYDDQTTPSRYDTTAAKDKDDSHFGRDAAVVGATGAGATAIGAHEHNKHAEEEAHRQAAKDQAAREKEHHAAERAAAKDEKKHEKELEKEERHHQKEVEKQEKHYQKELEANEKAREKGIAKEEKHHEKELEKQEKERREVEEKEHRRHEKEAAGGTAATGAGVGAAAYEAEKHHRATHDTSTADHPSKLHKDPPAGLTATDDRSREPYTKEKEKKPSIFKRIFKSRKNKDTGADEEYSTDEEEGTGIAGERDRDHRLGTTGGVAAVGAGAAGTAAVAGHEHHKDTSATTGTGYEDQSGGLQKPSYNPFTKDQPRGTDALPAPASDRDISGGDTTTGTGLGSTERTGMHPTSTTTPGHTAMGTESSTTGLTGSSTTDPMATDTTGAGRDTTSGTTGMPSTHDRVTTGGTTSGTTGMSSTHDPMTTGTTGAEKDYTPGTTGMSSTHDPMTTGTTGTASSTDPLASTPNPLKSSIDHGSSTTDPAMTSDTSTTEGGAPHKSSIGEKLMNLVGSDKKT